MTKAREKAVSRSLWTLYGVLAVAGLALLAEALFVPRVAAGFPLALPSEESLSVLGPRPGAMDRLVDCRFTRRVAGPASAEAPALTAEQPLDKVIKLTGILDFGGKQPALAVIETATESKAYKAGDKVGETGIVVHTVKDYVVVEFEKRRFKVTFLGVQELAADAVGRD